MFAGVSACGLKMNSDSAAERLARPSTDAARLLVAALPPAFAVRHQAMRMH
jgi:hypothetical protein